MAYWNEYDDPPGKDGTDGISCVGLMLIGMLIMVTLVVGLGSLAAGRQDRSDRMPEPVSDMSGASISGLAAADTAASTGSSLPEAGQPLARVQTAGSGSGPLAPNASPPAGETPLPASPTPTEQPPATATATETPPPPTASPTAAVLIASRPTETPRPALMPTPGQGYSWTLEVPILMYHYISVPPEDADVYRRDLSVSPETFRAHMQYLADNGYTTIDLYDLSLAIVNKLTLPEKPVIVSLDDGYRDNYENAFPVLQELGQEATFFVATEFVDQNNPNYMTWAMIEEMAAAGMRIEPHSKTHPDLSLLERDGIIWQVRGSQETIAAHTGSLPRYFAYPSGRYDDEVLQVMADLDFWGAVTTMGGRWHGFNDRYEWTRMRVHNNTTAKELVDLLE